MEVVIPGSVSVVRLPQAARRASDWLDDSHLAKAAGSMEPFAENVTNKLFTKAITFRCFVSILHVCV